MAIVLTIALTPKEVIRTSNLTNSLTKRSLKSTLVPSSLRMRILKNLFPNVCPPKKEGKTMK